MISHRCFYGFGIFAFLMSFICLAGGISLMFISGPHQSNEFIPLSLLWNGFGILGCWLGANSKVQAKRLDKLEAEIRSRTGN